MRTRHRPIKWPPPNKRGNNIRQPRIPQIPSGIPSLLLLIRPKEPPSTAFLEHIQLSAQKHAALAVLLAVIAAGRVRVRVECGAELADDEVSVALRGKVAEPVGCSTSKFVRVLITRLVVVFWGKATVDVGIDNL